MLVGALFRERRQRVALWEAPPPSPVRRLAYVSRLLALAHHLQGAIDRGRVPDRAMVARRLGLTRARVMQFLDLLLLAPDLQDYVLHLEAVATSSTCPAISPLVSGDGGWRGRSAPTGPAKLTELGDVLPSRLGE